MHLKDVDLPEKVRNAVAKAYPGWSFEKDTYKMTHHAGNGIKERYKIVLEKGKERKKVFTDARGRFLVHHLI